MISFKRQWIWLCFAGIVVLSVILAAGWNFCMQRPSTVRVRIRLDAPISGGMQVYYRTEPNEAFSDTRCIPVRMSGTPAVADVVIPARRLCGLRFDFGVAPGEFTMLGGTVGDEPLPPWDAWSFSPDVTVKSDRGESGGLKLFSDGADPYMFVSFCRPVQSSRTLNRKRLVLMLALALAVALVAISFKRRRFSPRIVGIAVLFGTLLAGWNFCMQRTIRVQVRLDAPISGGMQIYYCARPGEAFSDTRCIPVCPIGTPAIANVALPVRQLYGLRFDFGAAPGAFTMLGGIVGDKSFPPWDAWSFSPDVTVKSLGVASGELKLFSDRDDPYMFVSFCQPIQSSWTLNRERLVLLLTFLLAVALATGRGLAKRAETGNPTRGRFFDLDRPAVLGVSVYESIFLLACLVYYASWIFQPFNFSPDEEMRFEVTRFLFDHGRLPVNEETINGMWGFSYAHLPIMFCNVFGALFMKIGSLFTSDATVLLRAARMLGVLCITGTVYWTIRTSRLLFRTPFNWLPVCIVAFLPQFAYVGSYVNNDSAALLGSSMILFAWVSAIGKRWDYGNATILSVGIAICATSYYNSYSWVLFSIVMFPLTYIVRNGRTGLVKMGLFISVVSFVLAGYLFLRHLYLYGDLLGFATCKSFAMEHAIPDYVPGVKKSLHDNGCSLLHMLFGMKWLERSALSFVGYFGQFQFAVPSGCYWVYAAILGIGGLGAFWKGWDWICGRRRVGICKWAFLVSLFGCMMIAIGLSMYYSFMCDYQCQGRYCFPALLPMALLSAKGIERIMNGIAVRKIQGAVVFALCLLLGLVTEVAYLFFRSLV